jgi:hypothetical protein
MARPPASKLQRLRAQTKSSRRVRRLKASSVSGGGSHLGPAVARYLFSARHAFVYRAVLTIGLGATTSHLVARHTRVRQELVDFIVNDLVRARLLVRQTPATVFRPVASKRLNDWIKRFADPDLDAEVAAFVSSPLSR